MRDAASCSFRRTSGATTLPVRGSRRNGWRVLAVAEELEPPELFEMFREAAAVDRHRDRSGRKGVVGTCLARGAQRVVRRSDSSPIVISRGQGSRSNSSARRHRYRTAPPCSRSRTGSPLVVGALLQRPGGRYHARRPGPDRGDGGQVGSRARPRAHGSGRAKDGRTDQTGAGAVAPLPAELAERPRLPARIDVMHSLYGKRRARSLRASSWDRTGANDDWVRCEAGADHHADGARRRRAASRISTAR